MSPPNEPVSTKPLLDKLGVRIESHVALIGTFAPDFVALLRKRTKLVSFGEPLKSVDVIFLAANSLEDLEILPGLRERIVSNGAIWVVSLKGKQATIRDTDVIAAGLDAGLVDNKVVAFSDAHTAQRLVIRIRDRH